MSVEIISTGNEILSGLTLDTNFSWASSRLSEIGVSVNYHTAVRDDLSDLISAFYDAEQRAKAVIVTGGLGPTEDDLSSLAASRFLSCPQVFNNDVYESIVEKLGSRGLKPNMNHRKQALFPEKSEILTNNLGTAAGFRIETDKAVFFFLPGVPKEFKPMFSEFVLPELEATSGKGSRLVVKTLKTFGLVESELANRLNGMSTEDIKIGYRLKFPEVHLRVVAELRSRDSESRLKKLIKEINERLGDNLFTDADESLEDVASRYLLKNNLTIATAESCTGGLLASRLTDIPGSSGYFLRGVVAYSNESKVDLLNVSADDIEKYGAVSSEVVVQMARNVREMSDSDIGVGISGIAGPGGGTEDKPVGTVYIGYSFKNGEDISQKHMFNGSRKDIKEITCSSVINKVRIFCLNYV